MQNTNRYRTKGRRAGKGQAAVEFALVASILLLILFGIIELGRLMFINAEIENAASEAAQYAALQGPCGTTFQDRVLEHAKSKLALADRNGLSADPVSPPGCAFCPVQVTVHYHWKSMVGFIHDVDLSKSTTKLIEYVPGPCPP